MERVAGRAAMRRLTPAGANTFVTLDQRWRR
jgi:hypothetical protein